MFYVKLFSNLSAHGGNPKPETCKHQNLESLTPENMRRKLCRPPRTKNNPSLPHTRKSET